MTARWRWQVPGVFTGSFLFVVGDRGVLQVHEESHLAMVALSLDDGQIVWRRPFEYDTVEIFFPFESRLFLDGLEARTLNSADGGTVAEKDWGERVTVRPPIRSGPVYWLEESGIIMGLDPATLDELWRWPDPEGACLVHDDVLCSYERDGVIEVVDFRTGVRLHRCQGPRREKGSLTRGIWNHLLIQTYERRRVAIDVRTGGVVWDHSEEDDGMRYLMQFAEGVACAGGTRLSACDLGTGNMIWRQDFSPYSSALGCIPVVRGGYIYGGTRNGLVFVVNAATGEVESSFQVPHAVNAVAPAPGGLVVVGSSELIECHPWPPRPLG